MPTTVEIVSPERLLLSQAVDMVVIPGSAGEMGVLPGHAPMIITLQGGTVRLYRGDQITDRLFVTGGFAEITPERCTVLADEAVRVEEIVRGEAERQLAEAQAAYDAADKMDIVQVDRALDRLQAARSRIDATTP